MTLAKAFVTGSVVKEPEKRFTQNDLAIAGFTLSIENNPDNLIRVIAFGNLADNISNTIKTGDMVAVEGKLQANTYKLPNGKDKKVYEINAGTIEKMGVSEVQPAASSESENIVTFEEPQVTDDLIDEDEIPF